MSAQSPSSRISMTRPKTVSWRYQLCASSTVSETRGSRRMCCRRTRDASMLTSTWSPSQMYHVTAVWGEPSLRSVAITAGFAFRRSWSASGGSGSLGISFSFLPPVALEAEIRLLEGSGALIVRRVGVLGLCEVDLCRSDELLLSHPFAHALRPHSKVFARTRHMIGDVLDPLDDAEVDQREPRRLVPEHVVERALPRLEVDVRWRG